MSGPVESQLYYAARHGLVSEVSTLLSDHPEINVNWTSFLETPLHVAANKNHPGSLKLLLAYPGIEVNLKNGDGRTPSFLGCWNGSVSVVRLLLENPLVDVTLDDNEGRTPL